MNKLHLSLALNVVLAGAAVFFTWKRLQFQHDQKEDRAHHRYWENPQYKEQISIQRTYDKPADIVMLGNSHIYKAQWNELLDREDIAARGIGSDMTDGYLARLDQVLKVHPRIVFIEGGANDLYYERPIDSIIHNLKELVDTLEKSSIQPVLHTLLPIVKTDPNADDYNARVRELNKAIIHLCHRLTISCIDLYALFQKDGYLAPAYAQEDGVHLTGEAYKTWARVILKKLQEKGTPSLTIR